MNEEFYLDFFIKYYLSIEVDEIHFFDSASQDGTLDIIHSWSQKNKSVKLICSDKGLRHTSFAKQTAVCNMVLQHAKTDVRNTQEATWWMFPDVDEVLRSPPEGLKTFFHNMSTSTLRSVGFDWYLPPELMKEGITIEEVFRFFRKRELKGRLLGFEGDPFYKDFIFYITLENLNKYSTLQTIAGNHRYWLHDELFIPPNEPFLIFDHFRGGNMEHIKKRVEERMNLLDEKEHMTIAHLMHFNEVKNELHDYESFYNSLKSFQELENLKPEITIYDNSTSLYNQKIKFIMLQYLPAVMSPEASRK